MPGVQGKLNTCSFGGDFTSNFEQQLRRYFRVVCETEETA